MDTCGVGHVEGSSGVELRASEHDLDGIATVGRGVRRAANRPGDEDALGARRSESADDGDVV